MICINCVTPIPLKNLIRKYSAVGNCKYCECECLGISTNALFNYIYDRIEENIATEEDLTHYELSMLYQAGADLVQISTIDNVLMDWLELGNEPYFEDLCAQAPSQFKVDDSGNEAHFYYDCGTLEHNIYEERWNEFVRDINHKYRYFNVEAIEFLDSVFSPLISYENQLNPEIVRTISNGEFIYRARDVRDEKQAEKIIDNPAHQFGPPPRHLASNQRMTPSGISALYCALERETCLSEIRPLAGDHVVSVALTPANKLHLLDLTALDKLELPTLTPLDKGFRKSVHKRSFLGSLVEKMSRPKTDSDSLSYLSTQVVFEYLRLHFGKYVDGLIFPSVQMGGAGTNLVLFVNNSASFYRSQTDPTPINKHSIRFTKSDDPSEALINLLVVEQSFRFHKITAIQAKSKEYSCIYGLFISDLTRKRLGLD